jgi:hypothetical protein
MTRLPLLISALFAASASTGCIEVPSDVPAEAPVVVVDPLPYSMHFETRDRLAIRDRSAWEATWKAAGRDDSTPPAVDFSRHAIIIASMGPGSGSNSIHIDGVHLLDGNMWIQVRERSPAPECPATLDLRYPVAAVMAPRFTGKVTFIEHIEKVGC